MTLVAFVRGANVGGHRRFRPSVVAKELSRYGVVSIGAAGTFIVRRPVAAERFRAALLEKLPFDAPVALCDARDLARVVRSNPFETTPASTGIVRFVSILSRPGGRRPRVPLALPNEDEWFVRVLARDGRLVVGEYRRHLKTISQLGRLDVLFGAPAITRSWDTIRKLVAASG